MKRGGFARKTPARVEFDRPGRQSSVSLLVSATLKPLAKAVYAQSANDSGPVEKENPLQHAAYMDLVRGLRCYRCKRAPRSQFCHTDLGKGKSMKTDCRLGWPGCADCHYLVGSTGKLGKQGRRDFEAEASRATRAEIRAMGKWPATLPAWPGDQLEVLP